MNFPKVSIITVTYNAAADLRRTLENISQVDYPSLEVIIIDGASQDNTAEVVEEFRSVISYYSSEPDSGIYDAMNKGIAAATGEYIWFVNSGDLIHDGELLKMIFLGRNNLADIYYGETIIRSEDGKLLGLRRKPLPRELSAASFKRGMVVCHQSIIVRREIAPMYDLSYRYAADIEWVLNVLERAKNVVNTRLIMSEFFEGGTSTQRRRESLKERFAIMRNHYGLITTLLAHVRFCFDIFGPKYRKIY